jgi:hypothetical protein
MSNATLTPQVGSRVRFSAATVKLPAAHTMLFDLHHHDDVFGTLVQLSPDGTTGGTVGAIDVGLPYYCIVAREDIRPASEE